MDSKGVSQAVATVLLMSIAIATASSAAVFLQGTMSDLQGSVESWIGQEDKKSSSSITLSNARNGTSGYLLADVRNTGSRTLSVVEDGSRLLKLYLDNKPEEWEYLSGSPYIGNKDVGIDPSSSITLNTTKKFPDSGSVKIEFSGPYNTRASYICSSLNGACQN
jgi:FlaG/FlaF family flagellin (archaellin)